MIPNQVLDSLAKGHFRELSSTLWIRETCTVSREAVSRFRESGESGERSGVHFLD
jgi:IS4 transposase